MTIDTPKIRALLAQLLEEAKETSQPRASISYRLEIEGADIRVTTSLTYDADDHEE